MDTVRQFGKELVKSDLITCPPTDCREYFTRYDKTLWELLDKHEPWKLTVQRSRATAPWFNSLCLQVKARRRSLKKFYRATHSVTSYREWRIQSDVQRRVFQTAYTDYWPTAIKSCSDSKTLWWKLNTLLQPTDIGMEPHSADNFASYYTGNVEAICATTVNAPSPVIRSRSVPPLDNFTKIILSEVTKVIQIAPSKQCMPKSAAVC